MRWEPRDYQQAGVRFIVTRPVGGILDDPGLGKTITMLSAFNVLKVQRMVRTMLVIAPLRPAYQTWPAEVKKWEHTQHLRVVVLHGPKKESLLKQCADIYVINPEGLPWLFSQQPCPKFDVLCVDESTRFKHPNTARFKIIKQHLNKFSRRYILTGSPTPNGLLDLFGQIFLLDQGAALGRFITHYRSTFFDATGFDGYTYKPKPGAEETIRLKIQPISLRRSAADYLTLPPLIGACGQGEPLVHEVELPAPAMKIYKSMEKELIAQLEAETIVSANAAAAFGKCRQISNGGLYGPEDASTGERAIHHIHDEKVDAVEELIEESSGVPTLVAYEFEHDLIRLKKRFPDAPHIGGGVSAKRFAKIEQAWNCGSIPVLLAQPQSVAHGLNLQATRANVIFHSLTPDLEVYEQFIRRVWRSGQQHRVFVHHIVAKGTVDKKILSMLQRKDGVQQRMLESLKAECRRES